MEIFIVCTFSSGSYIIEVIKAYFLGDTFLLFSILFSENRQLSSFYCCIDNNNDMTTVYTLYTVLECLLNQTAEEMYIIHLIIIDMINDYCRKIISYWEDTMHRMHFLQLIMVNLWIRKMIIVQRKMYYLSCLV